MLIDTLLGEYEHLSHRLAELYVDQAQHKAAEIETFSQIWQASVTYGITERNALAKQASSFHTAELTRIEGDIQATLSRLRFLDRQMQYAHGVHSAHQE